MESAVPRKIAVTSRASGLGRYSAGSISPSAKPQANGMATPASAMAIAARPTRRTICRSVSMPVSSNSISTPSSETASSMLFCAGSPSGKTACCADGQSQPKNEGPSNNPPTSWPMTEGWPMRCANSPISRPTRRRSASSAMNSACDPVRDAPSAASAGMAITAAAAASSMQTAIKGPLDRRKTGVQLLVAAGP